MRGADRSSEKPSRKTPAHPPVHLTLNRPTIVFLTVCVENRRPILARPDVHALLVESWTAADAWLVGRYVIMPNHTHVFCAPANMDVAPLKSWVHYWKSLASRKWPRPNEQPVWQKSFWDTQLRACERYGEKWEYVRNNPVREGLVSSAESWPYQGELNELSWW